MNSALGRKVFGHFLQKRNTHEDHDVVVAGQEAVKLGVNVSEEAAAGPVPSVGGRVQGEVLLAGLQSGGVQGSSHGVGLHDAAFTSKLENNIFECCKNAQLTVMLGRLQQ